MGFIPNRALLVLVSLTDRIRMPPLATRIIFSPYDQVDSRTRKPGR